jgi:hypothetical protein
MKGVSIFSFTSACSIGALGLPTTNRELFQREAWLVGRHFPSDSPSNFRLLFIFRLLCILFCSIFLFLRLWWWYLGLTSISNLFATINSLYFIVFSLVALEQTKVLLDDIPASLLIFEMVVVLVSCVLVSWGSTIIRSCSEYSFGPCPWRWWWWWDKKQGDLFLWNLKPAISQ